MAETMKRPNSGSVLSRLEYLNRKMGNPKTSAKEMKILEIRQKNLLEMMEDGMEEFNKGGLIGGQAKLDKNNDGEISGADFKMMKNGGRVQVKGMAMGGKVKAKGMAMGGKIKSKGYAMGGKVKAKGMAMGGKVMSKGYAMGGRVMSKGEAMGGAGFGAARSSGKPIVTY
tara:strand:- start:309 stop:818 length:510 start_codon:yes stop_codon:yes gene_type:complete